MKTIIRLSLCITLFPSLLTAWTLEQKDFSKQFGTFRGTIVISKDSSEQCIVHNKKRAATRLTPCSTFKIPNSIIALETGVIADVDSVYEWDTIRYPAQDWWFPQ